MVERVEELVRSGLVDHELAQRLADHFDRMSPLPTDDRIRMIVREELQRTFLAVGLPVDDKNIGESGDRLRRALKFPQTAWAFAIWFGGAFIVALLGALATLGITVATARR